MRTVEGECNAAVAVSDMTQDIISATTSPMSDLDANSDSDISTSTNTDIYVSIATTTETLIAENQEVIDSATSSNAILLSQNAQQQQEQLEKQLDKLKELLQELKTIEQQ